ncbi:hypothetical protein G7Z17_g4363 [Cylindrodendrum hubeiense]|uniref:F-box domain-containing protein n=1 Tax=Cylindrodendrum hubeiense TaxID=595255 RepID=A0A9P5LIF2_9HYPO|nr:hypothetical protein G7Z17_g4363 [Cylindrodendrum hubeiense]
MSKTIFEILPDELLLCVTSWLTPHELARLMRTCKRFNALVEPLLWTDIELHEAGFHESHQELKDPPPLIPTYRRAYHRKQGWGCGQGARDKAAKFFTVLQILHDEDPSRLQELTRRVRNLCSVAQPELKPWDEANGKWLGAVQIWQLLPYFTNLETLELHGDNYYSSKYEEATPEFTMPPLNLRFAKLFGYIPRSVARWVLRGGGTIERLELGMLDRPISTYGTSEPEFPPLPEENLAESDDDESYYGSLCDEAIVPRPQSGFLPEASECDLPRVKHLYLCQPSEGNYETTAGDYSWSKRAEKACLADWRKIIQMAGQTLETLVLEQRPGAQYNESRIVTEAEFIRTDISGVGNTALVLMVEELIKDEELPELKKVYLYGMTVDEDSEGRPSANVPAGRFMTLLDSQAVQCEARLGQWCYFDYGPGCTNWARWDGSDDEDEEEDEEPKMKWSTLLASV